VKIKPEIYSCGHSCKACIMNSDGSIAEETEYNNTSDEAEIFTCSIVKKYGESVAVCEYTANVKLANPLKTKAIAEAKIKTENTCSFT
jgi:hypothetical protein